MLKCVYMIFIPTLSFYVSILNPYPDSELDVGHVITDGESNVDFRIGDESSDNHKGVY